MELHAHSAFSFLDGASTPAELALAAAEHGYPALALTDHDGIWGSREFAEACVDLTLRAITGAELTVAVAPERRAHLTLLVESTAGYRNLCRLLTAAHAHTRDNPTRSAEPPWATLEQLEAHAEGLVCLSGCARDGALAGAWERGETAAGEQLGRRLLGAFGRERFRVELQRPFWRHDRARNRWLSLLAERLGVPCVATGNVHSHNRRRTRLQDAFVAIGLGQTLEESEPRRRGNRSSALVSPREMAARFAEYPQAVAETVRLAERLQFDLTTELGYRHPRQGDPGADAELARLCAQRLGAQYAGSANRVKAEGRLERELATIRKRNLSGFFLLHHELLEHARRVAVEVRGRGSARGGAAARARARLQRQLDRLLPDRPLPHRPGRGQPLRGALPQRRRGDGPRHRPRLPPRHPRGADPARPRDLRGRPLGPGRGLPDLPAARRRAGPRQGPGAAAAGDREGRRARSASTSRGGRWSRT